MANKSTLINLYAKANSKTVNFLPGGNVELFDYSDGNGPQIKTWTVSGLAKPTDDQLNSYNSTATTEENNQVVIHNRKSEYGTTEHQIENIIENGLSAEQTRVQAIKDKYPKE